MASTNDDDAGVRSVNSIMILVRLLFSEVKKKISLIRTVVLL